MERRLRAAEAALLGGAPLRAESLAGPLPPSAPARARAQAEHLRVQARLATGRSVAEAPAMLLDAGLSCLDQAPGLARDILLEAAMATMAASQMTTGITPAELGGRILHALGSGVPQTGEGQLLTGLATLLAGRYHAAAPLLRQAIGMLAAEPGPRERVPVWLMAATFAATAIWEDRFTLEWMTRCEDLARRTGAMRPLTLCLIAGSISNGARGQLALAERQLAEGRELGQALGWDAGQLLSFSGVHNVAFSGNRQALRRAVAAGRTTAAARGSGDMIRVALAAQTILHLGYGEYADASAALIAPPDKAAQLYQEAIGMLGRTTATADLARAHLLFGEWLRRHQRPADARDHLQAAFGLFTSMGAIPFARRAQRAPSRRRKPRRTADPKLAAHRARIPDRIHGRRRLYEPGNRRPAVHHRPHRRVPPQESLPQTRHRLPPATARHSQRRAQLTGRCTPWPRG